MLSQPETLPGTARQSLASAWLDVGHGHRLYYEQAGTADGTPAILLHGGPGSGSSPRQREFFDAMSWRLIQFDQRGCGRSEPLGETAHNHTDALIEDIECLRRHLGIERWLVFGGSWGASLALAYAERHRERVSGLILRGLFLTGHADLDWFFHGVKAFAPEANARFIGQIPRRWRRRAVTYLARCFKIPDSLTATRLASAWQTYETALNGTRPDAVAATAAAPLAPTVRAKYRIQAHYLERKCFLGAPALLRAAASLGDLPVAIVHGTHDLVCRPEAAWRVHTVCSGSRLAWAALAGHDPYHAATLQLLLGATRHFAQHGNFQGWPNAVI